MKGRKRLLLCALGLALCALALAVLGRWLEKRDYPLAYPQLVAQYAQEYGLDPYLVQAVIHCESSGNPNARSRSGALGLMQVMPQTGQWIAGKLNLGDFIEEDLLDPSCSIRMGCWYLSFLLERLDNNLVHAVAAYNAGHGNVTKWLQEQGRTDENGQLNAIPFAETEEYVKRVQNAYEKYRCLYPDAFETRGRSAAVPGCIGLRLFPAGGR